MKRNQLTSYVKNAGFIFLCILLTPVFIPMLLIGLLWEAICYPYRKKERELNKRRAEHRFKVYR